MYYCTNCGTKNNMGDGFCTECGHYMKNPVTEALSRNPSVSGKYPVPTTAKNTKPGQGFALTSLILGILSILCFFELISIPFVMTVVITALSLLAIVFGAIAKGKGCDSKMATAGVICACAGLAVGIFLIIMYCSGMASEVWFLGKVSSGYIEYGNDATSFRMLSL